MNTLDITVKNHIETVIQRDIVLERPKDNTLGHYSTPIAFSLAKEFKQSPMIIAQDLVSKFDGSSFFVNVQAIKGFLNFRINPSILEEFSNEALENEENFCKKPSNGKQILLEYVSANPTGPLHIGHARGAVLGDTLYRIGTHLGYSITTEYYVNDAGSQMDLLGLSVCLAAKDKLYDESVTYPTDYYRGDYLIDIAHKVEQEFGKDIFYDEANYTTIASFAKDQVLDLIVHDLKSLGITFEQFMSEKSLYNDWINIENLLVQVNALYEKDGKKWLRSTEYKDDSDRVIVRENGIPTYFAGDIIYHHNKFNRHYDQYINIWGADHHGYIPRVKASLEFLGHPSDKLEIILSQMVSLLKEGEPYKMSKRAGNVILFSDVVEEIGSDALRFIFLTKKSDTHLEFDLTQLKNHDASNPIFYINYAHARINQLMSKSGETRGVIQTYSCNELNQAGIDLLYESLRLPSILSEAFIKRDIQKITDYLYSLSSVFHQFYNQHKIIGVSNQNSILKMLLMVSLTIRTGLKLLGIEAKERM